MDHDLTIIVAIIFLVASVGYITSIQYHSNVFQGLTGAVVLSDAVVDACSNCAGDPVCAAYGNNAKNYLNACAARCDGAHILYNGVCERI